MIDSQASAIASEARRELAKRRLLDFCANVSRLCGTPAFAGGSRTFWSRWSAASLSGSSSRCIPAPEVNAAATVRGVVSRPRCEALGSLRLRPPERLVVRNSRAVRDCFGEPDWPFDAKLAADATASVQWKTSEGGGLFGVGVGGTIRAEETPLLLCDDLEDGQSTSWNGNLEDWFRGKTLTRLEPGRAVVIVQTRWPNDDLPRRLMNGARGSQWTSHPHAGACGRR